MKKAPTPKIAIPHTLPHWKQYLHMMDRSFFLGRETLIARVSKEMTYWRELLFSAMFRNATSITALFRIHSNRVVELGSQVVL